MYLLLLAETAFIETFSFSLHNWKLKLKWHQMVLCKVKVIKTIHVLLSFCIALFWMIQIDFITNIVVLLLKTLQNLALHLEVVKDYCRFAILNETLL